MFRPYPLSKQSQEIKPDIESFTPVVARKRRKKYDVIISGSGPAGLSLAYELIMRNYSVLLIDTHDESIRPQLVFLTNSINYLKKIAPKSPTLDEDKIFIDKMKNDKEHYNIKDIERFFKRRLFGKKNCYFMTHASIKKIDMEKGIVQVDSKSGRSTTFHFKHLMGADGAKHPTADILKEMGYNTGYHPIPSHKRIHHITAYFTIQSRSDQPIFHLTNSAVFSTAHDMDRYIYHYTERSSHEKSNGTKMKACLTMTLPQDLYERWERDLSNPDLEEITRQEMQDEIQRIAQHLYPEQDIVFTKSRKHGQAKDQLKIQLFKTTLFEANQAAILVNGHIYARVGDALRMPDFYQGHGVTLSFLEAEALAKALDTLSLEEAIKVYHQHFRSLSDIAITKRAQKEKFREARFRDYQLSKLANALAMKDMTEIQRLLQHPLYDSNCVVTQDGLTPFSYVVIWGDLDALHAFLQHPKTEPNQADEEGNTPLHFAVNHNNVNTVQALLTHKKIKPNQKNNENCTPLQLAMIKQRDPIVDALRSAILQEIKELIRDTPFRTSEWEAQIGSVIKIDGRLIHVPRPIFVMWSLIEEAEANLLSTTSALAKIIQIGNDNAVSEFLSGTAVNKDRVTLEFYEKFMPTGEYTATRILGADQVSAMERLTL